MESSQRMKLTNWISHLSLLFSNSNPIVSTQLCRCHLEWHLLPPYTHLYPFFHATHRLSQPPKQVGLSREPASHSRQRRRLSLLQIFTYVSSSPNPNPILHLCNSSPAALLPPCPQLHPITNIYLPFRSPPPPPPAYLFHPESNFNKHSMGACWPGKQVD